MSASSEFDTASVVNGGIWPVGCRTKLRNAENETGGGAILGPTAPWASLPWQAPQPRLANSRLPFWAFPAGETSSFEGGFCPRTAAPDSARIGKATSTMRASKRAGIAELKQRFCSSWVRRRFSRQRCEKHLFTLPSSTRLRRYINKCRLPTLHHIDRATDRWSEVFWIRNRSLGIYTHALCHFCVVDVGMSQRSANIGALNSSTVSVRHDLHLHDLLMISTVVMHDVQDRNVVMRGCPQDAWGIHQIAVVLNVDR